MMFALLSPVAVRVAVPSSVIFCMFVQASGVDVPPVRVSRLVLKMTLTVLLPVPPSTVLF